MDNRQGRTHIDCFPSSHQDKTRIDCLIHSGGREDEDPYRLTPSSHCGRMSVFKETPREIVVRVGLV